MTNEISTILSEIATTLHNLEWMTVVSTCVAVLILGVLAFVLWILMDKMDKG